MTRLLVAAWAGSANLGDELLLSVTLGLLRERGVTPVVISADPTKTTTDFGVEAVHHLNVFGIRNALSKVDGVVFGGGGLLQDETSRWNLPFHLSRLAQADKRDLPWVGIGIGAAGITTERGEAQVRAALTQHLTMVVRDANSRDRLEALGVQRVQLGADLAFLLDAPQPRREPFTNVSLRLPQGSSWIPGALARQPAPDLEWISALARSLDEISADSGRSTRFVAFDQSSDDILHELVAAEMTTNSAQVSPPRTDLLSVMAAAEACISMRYHGVITSAICGVPSVALAFSPKLANIAEQLTMPSLEATAVSFQRLPGLVNALSGAGLADATAALRLRSEVSGRAIDQLLGAT